MMKRTWEAFAHRCLHPDQENVQEGTREQDTRTTACDLMIALHFSTVWSQMAASHDTNSLSTVNLTGRYGLQLARDCMHASKIKVYTLTSRASIITVKLLEEWKEKLQYCEPAGVQTVLSMLTKVKHPVFCSRLSDHTKP